MVVLDVIACHAYRTAVVPTAVVPYAQCYLGRGCYTTGLWYQTHNLGQPRLDTHIIREI